MGKGTTTAIGLLVGLVLFFAVNVLANAGLRSVRLDMTADRLFTLTDGSKRIAESLSGKLRLKLYVSEEAIEKLPPYAAYAQRVEEMLEEYALASGGMIEVSVIDPEPYSDAESDAVEGGLRAAPLGTGLEKLYFGLVATNDVLDSEVIGFFDPRRQSFLEYELTRIIHTLDNPERQVVGVLSSLELGGGEPNPMTMQPAGRRWPVISYLDALFDTVFLGPELTSIPIDVDVLLLVHPKELSDATRYAVDQFVLGGGKAIVCVDAWCDADLGGAAPNDPFGGMNAEKSSSLPGLLESWGVELSPARIAADRANALSTYDRSGELWPMIVWLGLGPDAFDGDDAVTSRLKQVVLATAGILRPTEGATTTLTPLIRTSEDSMDLDQGAVRFQRPPKELLGNFVPRKERYTLAARITGPATSAFPGGKPEGGESAAEGHLAEGEVHLIVVSDADFLHERFWLRESFFGAQKTADNGDFLVNAIENLAGGDDLIAVRGRGDFARPFDRVEEIRRDAEERYLNEEQMLQSKLDTAEERINELLQQGGGNTIILTPEVEEEMERVREEMAETNRQLRDVQYSLSKDIKRLGSRLKWINVGAVPALVCLTAIVLGLNGRRRRRKSA